MNRDLYLAGITITALYVGLNLFQIIVYLLLGSGIYFLQSFPLWFIFVTVVSLSGSLVLIKYYHWKKYWLTFFMAIILTLVSLVFAIVVYNMVVFRELESFYNWIYSITHGFGLLYGLCLLFSKTRTRFWLRTEGLLLIVVEALLITFFFWFIMTEDLQIKVTLENIIISISAIGALLPVPFIMNFYTELASLKEKTGNTKFSETVKFSLTATIFIASLPLIMFASDSLNQIRWKYRGPEKARVLAQPFEPLTYGNSNGDTLLYRLLKPLDYDPQKEYPLVVSLHGGSGHGNDNVMQIEGAKSAQLLSSEEYRKKYPAFVFVPQCPKGSRWGGGPNYPRIDSLVFEAISALEKKFEIDEKKRYVVGMSGGGYGTWHFITSRPYMFAAAIPICGGGNTNLAKNIVDVPIWAFHGEKDRSVPVRFSRDMIEAVKNEGGHPLYTEFPKSGHLIWSQVQQTPGLMDWLFNQKRE